jgi:caffeoyl-CoA O-methyltransferase
LRLKYKDEIKNMKIPRDSFFGGLIVSVLSLGLTAVQTGFGPGSRADQDIDQKVRSFLESQRGKWHDMNIPAEDGRVLYNLIIKHGYKKALEIGTSTGHSGTWIAWALSKTGGKLITIEIDKERHDQAVENFRKAGLAEYVDARLGDVHDLVPKLEGPFDLVFVDADKEWYTNYLKAVLPRLEVGGCFTAHNVRSIGSMGGIREFLNYVRSLPDLETTIDESSGSGISISIKRK